MYIDFLVAKIILRHRRPLIQPKEIVKRRDTPPRVVTLYTVTTVSLVRSIPISAHLNVKSGRSWYQSFLLSLELRRGEDALSIPSPLDSKNSSIRKIPLPLPPLCGCRKSRPLLRCPLLSERLPSATLRKENIQ